MATEDEQAILSEREKFQDAWNNGDAETAGSFFTEDGIRVGIYGDEQHGRKEIAAAYQKMLDDLPGAEVRQEHAGIRFLTPELAVGRTRLELTLNDGSKVKGYTVEIVKKVEGRWLILEAHPKIIPPPLTG